MAERTHDGHRVETSNEDKPLFPGDGPTKGRVIDYYARVAEVALPHLRDRPLVLKRCPDGIDDCFYQKQVGRHAPSWIRTTTVDVRKGGRQSLVVADSVAALVWLADQAAISLHPWLSRADRPDHPDQMIVDLDPPGERPDFGAVRRAARHCRDLLRDLGLVPFVKTTGSRGLHVVVPLDRAEGFDAVRAFARDAMDLLAARYPDDLTTETRKAARRGRLYLDVARNAYGQTAVAPYSLRALPGAPVATPIAWDELSRGGVDASAWTIDNLFRRLGQRDDPWSDMRRHAASLDRARRRLERRERDRD